MKGYQHEKARPRVRADMARCRRNRRAKQLIALGLVKQNGPSRERRGRSRDIRSESDLGRELDAAWTAAS